jgi:hypothetical protein
LHATYDCAATEAKAAAHGYRITPLLDRIYTLYRKTFGRAARRARLAHAAPIQR